MKLPPGARKVTDFEANVYRLCSKVPAGKVTTYSEIAAALASSARAVGQALRRNPFAPTVPCHRVVAADFKLGGFFGQSDKQSTEVQRKCQILIEEGVEFTDKETVNEKSFHAFETSLKLPVTKGKKKK